MNKFQRCIDCQFCKWCHEVVVGSRITSSLMTYEIIVKKLTEADKLKFNNYHCFRRKQ